MSFIKSLLGSKKKNLIHQNSYNPSISTPEPLAAPRKINPFNRNPANSGFNPPAPTRRPAAPSPNPETDFPPAYQPPAFAIKDDRYAFLSTFDTVFLIDDSGSMAGRSWRETSDALASIAPICTQHDADGIDVYFLNAPDSPQFKNVKSAPEVSVIFNRVRPMGATPTGSRLYSILRPYLQDVERKGADAVKPLNIIVITDGVSSDDVEAPIINAAEKLDRWDAPAWQVGIQFFQVGNEHGAAKALQELDDDLKERTGCRDIVDTVPWSGGNGVGLNADGILKVVLGAVHKKLDRKKNSSELR